MTTPVTRLSLCGVLACLGCGSSQSAFDSTRGDSNVADDAASGADGSDDTAAGNVTDTRDALDGGVDSTTPASCAMPSKLVKPPTGSVVSARFTAPRKLIYIVRLPGESVDEGGYALYEDDLCTSTAKRIGVVDRPGFALDGSGVPVVFKLTGSFYGLARLSGGTMTMTNAGCRWSLPHLVDVFGSTAVVSTLGTSPRFDLFALDASGCDKTYPNVHSSSLGLPDGAGRGSVPARISPDGKRVLMAGAPSFDCNAGGDPGDNDFLAYDIATGNRSMVRFSPPVAQPECQRAEALAWYPDSRRVFVKAQAYYSLDTMTGIATPLTVKSAPPGPPEWSDVSPDGEGVLLLDGLGLHVSAL